MATKLTRYRRLILRIMLGYSAFGWGICVAGIFAPADTAFRLLRDIGSINPTPLQADPMFDYWLRMASGAFALIGLIYLALAIRPRRYAAALPAAGAFMILEGIILLVHGLRLELPRLPSTATPPSASSPASVSSPAWAQ